MTASEDPADIEYMREQLWEVAEALERAHAALDAEHGHTAETWADRKRWTAAKLDINKG